VITQNDLRNLFDADVYEQDGDKIGSAGQVYLDNNSGEPEWVTVKTGLFGTKESFVPLRNASLSEGRIVVPFGKDRIKNAPKIDADGQLTPEEEDELYRYYELNGGTETTTSGDYDRTAAGRADYDRTDTGRTDTGRTDYGRTDYDRTDTGRTDTGRTDYDRTDTGRSGDDAMTRSEERLRAGTQTHEAGRARLRKYVVTEQEQVEVPVRREEVRLEREPITDANRGEATSGPAITESEHQVTLREERPVVETEAVPVERVRLGKETVQDTERVEGEVRKEQIEFDDPKRS
jgi:uncharacterized protein (TIGR02271 family)